MVAQTVKNQPAMQETWVPSLGREDTLEKGMATHSSILASRIPMDIGAWWATVHGVAEMDTTEWPTATLRDRKVKPHLHQPHFLESAAVSPDVGFFNEKGKKA